MSYDIYIGEAEPVADEDGFRWRVKETTHSAAPIFANDAMTGAGNSRHPAYIAWSEFCERAGLETLFFDKYEGLMREHPGIQPLTAQHANIVAAALMRYKQAHPDCLPGFHTEPTPENMHSAVLARLEWLAWWMQWAIENCKHPALYNS